MIANMSRSHLNHIKTIQHKCRELAKEKGMRIRRVRGEVRLYVPGEKPRDFHGFIDMYNYLQGGDQHESKDDGTSR